MYSCIKSHIAILCYRRNRDADSDDSSSESLLLSDTDDEID